ncbi:MAG: type II toxin-antitoxin system HicA family toxin [Acidimicrobiales bacterium]
MRDCCSGPNRSCASCHRAGRVRHVLRHPDGRVVVPVHPSRDTAKGTLRSVLALVDMTAEDLPQLL